MINFPIRIADKHTEDKLRELITTINKIEPLAESTAKALAALPTPTINNIVQALQAGGSNPLNVTGLQGVTGTVQPSASIGLHSQRLTTTPVVGAFWVESDRLLTYIGEKVSGAIVWVYQSGVMYDTFANRPTDLGTNDVGALYIPSEHLHWCKWTGAAWLIVDDDGGTFKESVRALGAGYQLCDGSATSYLTASGANLVQTAFTTADETSNGAARTTFHRSSNVYSGTVVPATTPGFAGSIDSATTGISTGSASFNNVAPTATALTPPLTDPGHTHGVTGLTVTLPDNPVQYLEVLRYLRR